VAEIAHDAAKPGTQLCRLAQTGQMLPRGDKCFLRQILALGQTAGGTECEGTNQRLVARDYLPKGVPAAAQTVRHQFGIGDFHRSHGFGCHHHTV